MKALSVKQPWIHAILCESKDIENRSWRTKHRGWIALHASKTPRKGAVFPRGVQVPDLEGLDYSAICGVARLIDVVTKHRSVWFQKPGRDFISHGWVLADVRRLRKPIKCAGSLGLWNVPANVLRSMKR